MTTAFRTHDALLRFAVGRIESLGLNKSSRGRLLRQGFIKFTVCLDIKNNKRCPYGGIAYPFKKRPLVSADEGHDYEKQGNGQEDQFISDLQANNPQGLPENRSAAGRHADDSDKNHNGHDEIESRAPLVYAVINEDQARNKTT